jgi:tight adherence protein C
MEFPLLPIDYALLQMLLGAISVIFALLVLIWPILFQDNLEARLRAIEDAREQMRKRERARLAAGAPSIRLTTQARPFLEALVEKFRLLKRAEDPATALPLRQAGYRGRAPIVTFLAAQLIVPVLLFPIAFIYLQLGLGGQLPVIAILALALGVAVLCSRLPDLYIKNKILKRREEINKFWPDAMDLILLSVEAGMSVEMALRKVAEEIGVQSPMLAEELSLTLAELSYLQDRRQAYDNFAERTGSESIRAVIAAFRQSEKYGTSLGESLRALTQENRDMRFLEAEKRAAALPPRLTVPMILFFLPVLLAVLITPAILQVLAAF